MLRFFFICTDQQFRCNNFMCIDKSLACNGVDDCGDYSDEISCSNLAGWLHLL